MLARRRTSAHAVPRMPAWIRRSLFGRSTYGIIHPDPIMGDPYDALCNILSNDGIDSRTWTLKLDSIEKRLLNDLTPSAFEHLVVSLFQLERPQEVWIQVGGSGDGGVDGIGASQDGQVTGLLQCEWQYWGGDPFPENPIWNGSQAFRRYLAALRYPDDAEPPNCTFLDRQKIAELVAKQSFKASAGCLDANWQQPEMR